MPSFLNFLTFVLLIFYFFLFFLSTITSWPLLFNYIFAFFSYYFFRRLFFARLGMISLGLLFSKLFFKLSEFDLIMLFFFKICKQFSHFSFYFIKFFIFIFNAYNIIIQKFKLIFLIYGQMLLFLLILFKNFLNIAS